GCTVQKAHRNPVLPANRSQTISSPRSWPRRIPVCTGRGPGLHFAALGCQRRLVLVLAPSKKCARGRDANSLWAKGPIGRDTVCNSSSASRLIANCCTSQCSLETFQLAYDSVSRGQQRRANQD